MSDHVRILSQLSVFLTLTLLIGFIPIALSNSLSQIGEWIRGGANALVDFIDKYWWVFLVVFLGHLGLYLFSRESLWWLWDNQIHYWMILFSVFLVIVGMVNEQIWRYIVIGFVTFLVYATFNNYLNKTEEDIKSKQSHTSLSPMRDRVTSPPTYSKPNEDEITSRLYEITESLSSEDIDRVESPISFQKIDPQYIYISNDRFTESYHPPRGRRVRFETTGDFTACVNGKDYYFDTQLSKV